MTATTSPKKRPNPIWGLIFLVGAGLTLWGFLGHSSTSTPAPAVPAAPGGAVTVTYKLTGTAASADLTYTDGAGNIQQQTGKAVPLRTVSGQDGLSFEVAHGQYVSFSAQNDGAIGDLTCSIEADGVVLNTGLSSGGYAIVKLGGGAVMALVAVLLGWV